MMLQNRKLAPENPIKNFTPDSRTIADDQKVAYPKRIATPIKKQRSESEKDYRDLPSTSRTQRGVHANELYGKNEKMMQKFKEFSPYNPEVLPRSTENRLVVPWCKNRGRYLLPTELKVPEYLRGELRSELTPETMTYIFQVLNRDVKFRKARLDPKTHKFFSPTTIVALVILLIGSVVCLIGYAFLLKEIGLIYVFLVFLGLLFLVAGLRYLQVQKQQKAYIKQRVENYQQAINYLNKEYLREHDFQLVLGECCDWLEICFDPRKKIPESPLVVDQSYDEEASSNHVDNESLEAGIQTPQVYLTQPRELADQFKNTEIQTVHSPTRVAQPNTPIKNATGVIVGYPNLNTPQATQHYEKYGYPKGLGSHITLASTASKYRSPEPNSLGYARGEVSNHTPISAPQIKIQVANQGQERLQPARITTQANQPMAPSPQIQNPSVARNVQIRLNSEFNQSFGRFTSGRQQVHVGSGGQFSDSKPRGRSLQPKSPTLYQP